MFSGDIITHNWVAETQEPERPRTARYSECELMSVRWREMTWWVIITQLSDCVSDSTLLEQQSKPLKAEV